MKQRKIAKKGGAKEKAQPVSTAALKTPTDPRDAVIMLRHRVELIRREWPDDRAMQEYRRALEMAADALAEKYADCDVELQNGGQPLYYYLIAVE